MASLPRAWIALVVAFERKKRKQQLNPPEKRIVAGDD
jgi:hypothetical protein